jgi:hypothetical protein
MRNKVISLLIFILTLQISFESIGQIGFGDIHYISDTFEKPTRVLPVDMDNDNQTDIIASNEFGSIVLFKNTGNGIFDTAVEIVNVNDSISDIFTVDIDFDNDIDILLTTVPDSTIYWIENLSNNTFVTHKVYTEAYLPRAIAGSDINGDGNIDIVAAYKENIVWFKNDGSCNFSQPIFISNRTTPNINLSDFDKDGDVDLFTMARTKTESISYVYWYKNNGDGTFTEKSVTRPYKIYSQGDVELYDMDGDNELDLTISYSRYWDSYISVFLNDHNGNFTYSASALCYHPKRFEAYDFDSDGLGDIVTTSYSNGYFYKNQNMSFSDNTNICYLDDINDIKYADFDNDGDMDVLCSGGNPDLILWVETILLKIKKQPSDVVYCNLDIVELSVESSDASSFLWQTMEDYTSGYFYTLEENELFNNVNTDKLIIAGPDSLFTGWQFRCKVSNNFGSVYTDTAVITVTEDNEPPLLVTKDVVCYLSNSTQTILPVTSTINDLSDNCNYIDTTLSKSVFDCFDIGENIIQVTAVDGSGNSVTKDVKVTVIDTITPEIQIPETVTFFTAGDEYQIAGTLADPGLVYDNCGIKSCYNNINGLETLKGVAFPLGNNNVEWYAEDIYGNLSKVTINVLITNENSYSVYPNPFSNYLIITQKYEGLYSLNIINLTSEIVYSVDNITDTWFPVDLGFLTNGVYIVNIYSGNKESRLKIIKVNP